MPEPTAILIDDDATRECSIACDHGTVSVLDTGPVWSQDQLIDFAQLVLAARATCTCCSDERVWLPPKPPDHIAVTELRLYEVDEPDPDIDSQRPAAIPGRAVSAAADRVFGSRVPDDHPLDQDWQLVRWWWHQRQLGLLNDQR